MMKASGRGGRRNGAGRPVGAKTTGAGSQENKFQVRLADEPAAWLRTQGGNAHLKELALAAWRSATGQ
jgi:hypothetical protein